MSRKYLWLIAIILVIILAIGATVVLYEQQQVKTHLINANKYNVQMLANKPALAATSSLDEKLAIWNKNVPLLNSELTELRAADTMFASPQQKQYISVAIQLNGDNMALYNVELQAKSEKVSGDYNLGNMLLLVSKIEDINKNEISLGQTLSGLTAQYPDQFGFSVSNNTV